MQQTVDTLNAVMAGKSGLDKKVKAKLRYVTREYPEKIATYERKEAVLGNRNSLGISTFLASNEQITHRII